jgi:hypothetical protein
MAYLHPDVLDNGLNHITTHASRIDICYEEPATYTQATDTYSLGNKTSYSVGAPVDRTPSGRKVVAAAVTDGSVTGTNTATHWAISKTSSVTALLAANSLSAGQAVTSGNTWTVSAFDIGIPGPA